MRKLMVDETPAAGLLPLVDATRWYCVSRDGLATLCKNEADAHETAGQCDKLWPAGGPHRAVRMVDAAEVELLRATLTRQQASYEREIALDVAAERERCAGVAEHATQRRRQIVAALNGCAAERCAVAEAIRK